MGLTATETHYSGSRMQSERRSNLLVRATVADCRWLCSLRRCRHCPERIACIALTSLGNC